MTSQLICAWDFTHPLEREYHDTEWGRPVYLDRILFEFITLEGAQSGLSWLTILKKRHAYRQAFAHYDLSILAQYQDDDVESILRHFDVIKHRGKIASVFTNARAALKIQKEYGSLSEALWSFVAGQPQINHWQSADQIPQWTQASQAMSVFLKRYGFKFIGPTTCYAFMQAVGMVNDHLVSCPCHPSRQDYDSSTL